MKKLTFQQILQIVKDFPRGASLDDILQLLGPPVAPRTLQRYLALLSKNGYLIPLGRGRSRRYQLPICEVVDSPIPLSREGVEIRAKVGQPIQARRPVGYCRDFLDKYRPNETYYLSESTRSHLLKMGKSGEGSAPAGTYAKQVLSRLLIDLSWNSSRLEGNTYSLLETERLLDLGKIAEGKDSMESQMILNHKAAIDFMIESADQLAFNSFTICNLHALLSDNLLRDPRACGSLRHIPVAIGKSVYQPPGIPGVIEETFQQVLDTADAIKDPFEQSFFAMVQLPYLQPFLDVNKRVSRLAANIPFIRENLCPLSFVDVPENLYISGLLGVYEFNRIELLRDVFIWAYERSGSLYSATQQELGEPDPFRLRYRDLVMITIGEIVRERFNQQQAITAIKQKAITSVSVEDQGKFIEVVELELMSLHRGNIARFRLKPSEYDQWLITWK